ncbi:MAG: hypothetical protein DI629_21255 [Mesorhizobium amorphae]|nr:MAG: hypothetical protein DI629_21255 [Mesorhizobium amorphae]
MNRNSVSPELRRLAAEFGDEEFVFLTESNRVIVRSLPPLREFKMAISCKPKPRTLENLRARMSPDMTDLADVTIRAETTPGRDEAPEASPAAEPPPGPETRADEPEDDAPGQGSGPGEPAAPVDALDVLARLDERAIAELRCLILNGPPDDWLVITPDMVGSAIRVVDGAPSLVPKHLALLAGAAPGLPGPEPRAHATRPRPLPKRADAVARRFGVRGAVDGGASEELKLKVIDIFAKTDEPLRVRDIYALLDPVTKARYSSLRSFSGSASAAIRDLERVELVFRLPTRDGREVMWSAVRPETA